MSATVAPTAEHPLVQRLRHGDEAAYREVVERYQPFLLRIARRWVADPAAAEDVVQDTWLAFFTGIDRYAERASLRTWLCRILINCARASHRATRQTVPFSRLAAEPDTRQPLNVPAPADECPDRTLVAGELAERLQTAIAQLPPRQRGILTLRAIEGRPATETCALLRISPVNQRVLLHRARMRVRQEMASELRAS